MSNFVLLHGGAAGSWIWRPVEKLLQTRGHNVVSITFTGCGDRGHLVSKDITQATHITDVVNTIKFSEMDDIVLVAHSYSGTVVPGVYQEIREKIAKIIYFDALVLNKGESVAEAMGYMPAEQCAAVRAMIESDEAPVSSGVAEQQRAHAKEMPFKMSAEQQAWMLNLVSEFPASCTVSNVEFGAESITMPVDYIACTDSDVLSQHERAKTRGWSLHSLEGDHAAMVGNPEGSADLIESLSSR